MSSDIFNYPLIEPILSNYPKSQWSRLIIAFTVYGIHSLSPYYSLSKLSLNELESICGVPAENLSLQPTSVSGFIADFSEAKDYGHGYILHLSAPPVVPECSPN